KVIITWTSVGDLGYFLEEHEEPEIQEPVPLTPAEENDKRKDKFHAKVVAIDEKQDQGNSWPLGSKPNKGSIVSGYDEGDDALEQIFKTRQKKTMTNEDFVKTMLQAIKAYKRRAGPFLWTPVNAKELKQETDDAKVAFVSASATGTAMTQEQEDDARRVKRKSIKECSIAMSILKRTDKDRFGDLLKDLSNDYFKRPNRIPNDDFGRLFLNF
ncbi:MAG: hypothetical protein SGBAC_007580, partial [Bacillariaceae sp.]